jgi:prepilin-type N-terminal cleavage/methylation domain-containing protein
MLSSMMRRSAALPEEVFCVSGSRRGFAFVELMVVIAVSAILSAALLPAIQRIRERAERATCANNLKKIGFAVHSCQDIYAKLPPAIGGFPNLVHMLPFQGECSGCQDNPAKPSPALVPRIEAFPNPAGNAYGTIQFHLLPFLGEDELYHQTDPRGSHYNPQNNDWNFDGRKYVSRKAVPVYTCPSDPSANAKGYTLIAQDWGAGCYADNFQVFAPRGNWGGFARLPATFRNGTANTILFAERYASCDENMSAWAYQQFDRNAAVFAVWRRGPGSTFQSQPTPWDTDCDAAGASSSHRGGMNVGLGDGAVRFLARGIDGQTWWALCTPGDGNVLGDF